MKFILFLPLPLYALDQQNALPKMRPLLASSAERRHDYGASGFVRPLRASDLRVVVTRGVNEVHPLSPPAALRARSAKRPTENAPAAGVIGRASARLRRIRI